MVEIKVAHLQGINFHFIPADLDALPAPSANITAQAPAGLFPGHVFRVAQFNLLVGRPAAFDVQKRHFRPFQDHFGGGRDFDEFRDGAAHRNRRHFQLGQAGKITVDGVGRPLAAADGLDDRGRAGYGIPHGKHIRLGRGHIGHVDMDGAAPGPLDLAHGIHAVLVHKLTDGRDDRIGLDVEITPFHGFGIHSVAAFLFDQFGLEAVQGFDAAVLSLDFLGNGQHGQFDAFFLGMLHLFLVCGHFLARSTVGNGYVLASQPQTGSGGIDGHIAAADDHDLFSGCMPVSQGNVPQYIDGVDDLRIVFFARDVQLVGAVGPDGKEKGLKSLAFQVVVGDVFSETGVVNKLDPQVFYHGHFPVDDFPGKPVTGDAHHGHAAGHGQGFDDLHGIPFESQVIGRTHAAGPGADNAHLFVIARQFFRVAVLVVGQGPLSRKRL